MLEEIHRRHFDNEASLLQTQKNTVDDIVFMVLHKWIPCQAYSWLHLIVVKSKEELYLLQTLNYELVKEI